MRPGIRNRSGLNAALVLVCWERLVEAVEIIERIRWGRDGAVVEAVEVGGGTTGCVVEKRVHRLVFRSGFHLSRRSPIRVFPDGSCGA